MSYNNKLDILIDYNILKKNVIRYLKSLKFDDTLYKMSQDSDATIYSSIFALFIYDLFGETKKWGKTELNKWAIYINSHQDEKSGLYLPNDFHGELISKEVFQLTAFALSALSIVDAKPKYEFRFIDFWRNENDVKHYLENQGCWEGKPGSGNMAMFLGIFLTIAYENTNNKKYLALIECWFSEHEKNQNSATGFWERSPELNPFAGFQNSFHQLEIFNYWKHNITHYEKMVDRILLLYNNDGTFWSYPGGGACYDFDAVSLLINLGIRRNYKVNEIKEIMVDVVDNILMQQNMDGGFCENRSHPSKLKNILKFEFISFLFNSANLQIFLRKTKSSFLFLRKNFKKNKTHWTNNSIDWSESDLWSTWFRLLTLAEISKVFHKGSQNNWNFMQTIGLGWSEKNE